MYFYCTLTYMLTPLIKVFILHSPINYYHTCRPRSNSRCPLHWWLSSTNSWKIYDTTLYLFVRSAMKYNLKIQGFRSVMLCCSLTSRVTTQPSVTLPYHRRLIFLATPLWEFSLVLGINSTTFQRLPMLSICLTLKLQPNLTYPDINSVVAFSLVTWRKSLTVVNEITDKKTAWFIAPGNTTETTTQTGKVRTGPTSTHSEDGLF
jgi:hypothetical protein